MQTHNEKAMVDLFVEIEQTLPVDTFEINGVKAWPYIRLSLKNKIDAFFLINGGHATNAPCAKPSRSKLSRLQGAKQVGRTFASACGATFKALAQFPFRRIFSSRPIDVLMFCFNAPFLRVGERGINRNVVAMVEALERSEARQGKPASYQILQYTRLDDTSVHPDFPGLNISLIAAALNEWCRFRIALSGFKISCLRNTTELDYVTQINHILQQRQVPVVLETHKLQHEMQRIVNLANGLQGFLQRHGVKKVVNVCYYGYVGMAVSLACYREKIQCIEYQHGVQTEYHPLYSNWRNVPEQGYELIPDTFWVWGQATFDVINDWVQQQHFHKVEITGNAWLEYFQEVEAQNVMFTDEQAQQYSDKKLILVSLQAFPEHYQAHVTEAIKAFDDDYIWVLKEHPSHWLSDEHRESEFGELIRRGKVVIERRFSIYELLTLLPVRAHLTAYSTVAFECEFYGIPTLFFHENGVIGNANLIERASHLYPALDTETLLRNLQTALATPVQAQIFMAKSVTVADNLLKGLDESQLQPLPHSINQISGNS